MSNGLRVGVVGCGLIGRKRALALREQDSIVGVTDANAEVAAALATDLGTERFLSFDALLDAEPDVVIVATTHDALAGIGCEVMRRGCDVLLEKPAGRTSQEIERLRTVANESERLAMVGFNHRFHPGVSNVIAMATSGEFGEVMFVRARYGHGGRIGYDREWRADPYKSGGGELVDQGFHLFDLSRCLVGELPVASAFTSTVYWDMPVDDNAVITLGTSRAHGSPFANLHASCSEWKNLFDLEVYCRTAKFHLSGLQGSYGSQVLRIYRMKPEMGPPDLEVIEYPNEDVSWVREWEAVAAAVESRVIQSGDLAAAAYCHRVADAAYGDVDWR
jgi:predicted dehydrogenase